MAKLGFIGFGSMAKMLVRGLITSAGVDQEQIIITRKDINRLNEITELWPKVKTVDKVIDVAKEAQLVFLCVKPLEFRSILDQIRPFMNEDKHLISISGTVLLGNIEKIVDCKVTKIMPTIVSEVNKGITLVCHNRKVTYFDAALIEGLMCGISKVKQIDEKDFGFASELTSCAPGLISAVFREFVEAGARHTDSLAKEKIEEMVLHTLYGTAKLILEGNMSFENVIERVSTKGGITEEGVKVIENGIPAVFDEMFEKTLEKRKAISLKVNL